MRLFSDHIKKEFLRKKTGVGEGTGQVTSSDCLSKSDRKRTARLPIAIPSLARPKYLPHISVLFGLVLPPHRGLSHKQGCLLGYCLHLRVQFHDFANSRQWKQHFVGEPSPCFHIPP